MRLQQALRFAVLCAAPLAAQDALFEGFRNPPAEARPFVFWWWNGNHAGAGEIVRELDLLKAAGVGGVRIYPIDMPRVVNTKPAAPGLTWLSPEWNEMVKLAAAGARERGLLVELLAGTGWPSGGPWVKPEEALQRVQCNVSQMSLPTRYEGRLPVYNDPHRKIIQLRLARRNATRIEQVVDALPCLDPDGSLKFGRLKAPPGGGDYLLYAVTVQTEFRQVGQSAPGGEGLVLDHYNRPAVEKYLNRISDALAPVLGGRLGGTFQSLLSESIELGDANWTGDFFEQFAKRRGYSLEPYLALVLLAPSELAGTPLGDAVRRVQYDFHKTHAELMLERYYRPFHEWCRRQGVQSRLQAYGHPWLRTHLLDGYMVPDIPEGDTWVHWKGEGTLDGVRYAVWNKYASSAAHLNGRRVTGAETLTNLEGVFQTSLADAKQGADLTFAGGVNHLVLHGFNYSPPDTGFPGWLHYGTWLSEQNPWWRYVRRFVDYTARVSWLLQSSEPQAEIAILGPSADVWSRPAGLDRELWNNTPWYLHDLWQAFHQAGYSADYISPAVLLGATTEEGRLRYGPMRYRTLLVVEAESMEPEVAQALLRHVERGGRVIFIGRAPDRAPGLRQSDEAVRAAIRMALPRAKVAPAPERGAVLAWVRRHAHGFAGPPPVELESPDARVFQLHQSAGGRDVFFFVNSDRAREIAFTAALERRPKDTLAVGPGDRRAQRVPGRRPGPPARPSGAARIHAAGFRAGRRRKRRAAFTARPHTWRGDCDTLDGRAGAGRRVRSQPCASGAVRFRIRLRAGLLLRSGHLPHGIRVGRQRPGAARPRACSRDFRSRAERQAVGGPLVGTARVRNLRRPP